MNFLSLKRFDYLLCSNLQTCSSKITSDDSCINTTTIIGLNNLGNTCFLNSLIQCFAQNKIINKYFLLDNNIHKQIKIKTTYILIIAVHLQNYYRMLYINVRIHLMNLKIFRVYSISCQNMNQNLFQPTQITMRLNFLIVFCKYLSKNTVCIIIMEENFYKI